MSSLVLTVPDGDADDVAMFLQQAGIDARVAERGVTVQAAFGEAGPWEVARIAIRPADATLLQQAKDIVAERGIMVESSSRPSKKSVAEQLIGQLLRGRDPAAVLRRYLAEQPARTISEQVYPYGPLIFSLRAAGETAVRYTVRHDVALDYAETTTESFPDGIPVEKTFAAVWDTMIPAGTEVVLTHMPDGEEAAYWWAGGAWYRTYDPDLFETLGAAAYREENG